MSAPPSPYPFIDDFLIDQIRRHNSKDAELRSWSLNAKHVLKYEVHSFKKNLQNKKIVAH